ncbi:hypothetical protein R1sor_000206 [Riccia sorocarpa]|uniref:Cytochrome P450 n=1 Tax=Riccia sorocarpa TaxID=122646 RepID=A0ABD3GUY7_9MARC
MILQAMVSRTVELVEGKWSNGGVFDVYGDLNELTTLIVASSLFGGTRTGAEDIAKVGPAITAAFEYFARRATSMFIGSVANDDAVPEWVPTPDNVLYLSSVETLDRIVYDIIAQRRKALSSGLQQNTSAKDLLTRLLESVDLQATDEDGSSMDDRSLRDELMTFLVAGQETSAIQLTWSLVMLALNPRVQSAIFTECTHVLGSKLPTYDDVPKLRYLEAFIWESMRLQPPAYIVGRCASEDTTLGDFDINAGTTVLVSPYLLHRDPQYWSRARKFEPERWLPGGDARTHMENDSYWPFGGGPRSCIGMGFAMMEVALVLAITVSRFEIGLPAGASVPKPQAMITLRPENESQFMNISSVIIKSPRQPLYGMK